MYKYDINIENIHQNQNCVALLRVLEDILYMLNDSQPQATMSLHFKLQNNTSDFERMINSLKKQNIIYATIDDPEWDQSYIQPHLLEESIISINSKQLQIQCLPEYSIILQENQQYRRDLADFIMKKLDITILPHVEVIDSQLFISINQMDNPNLIRTHCQQYLESIHYCKISLNNNALHQFLINLTTVHQLDYVITKQQVSLRGYKTAQQPQTDGIIIYSTNKQSKALIDSLQTLKSISIKVELFQIFTFHYIPKFEQWISKHYQAQLTKHNVEDEQFILIGPQDQVSIIQEIIVSEHRKFEVFCGPFKLDKLTEEQFSLLQIENYFNCPEQIESIVRDKNPTTQDLYKNYLDPHISLSYQACMYISYTQGQLETVIDHYNMRNKQIIDCFRDEMIRDAERVSQQHQTGTCVIYMVVVQSETRKQQLKHQFNEMLQLSSDYIYDQKIINYLYKESFDVIGKLQETFSVVIDVNIKQIEIQGKVGSIQKVIDKIKEMYTQRQVVTEYFDFETVFYLQIANTYFTGKLEQLAKERQSKLSLHGNQINAMPINLNPRITIIGPMQDVMQLKVELGLILQQIKDNIQEKIIQLDRTNHLLPKQLIKELQSQFVTQIIEGPVESEQLIAHYQYKLQTSTIRVCTGNPMTMFVKKQDQLKLNNCVFIIPVLKKETKDVMLHQWETDLIQKVKKENKQQIKQCSSIVNAYDYKFKLTEDSKSQHDDDDYYEVVMKDDKNKKKGKKQVEQYIHMKLYNAFYCNDDMANNFYYFDKVTINRSIEIALQEIQHNVNGLSKVYISLGDNQYASNIIQQLLITINNIKMDIDLLVHQTEYLDDINEQISRHPDIKVGQVQWRKSVTQKLKIRAFHANTIQHVVDVLMKEI